MKGNPDNRYILENKNDEEKQVYIYIYIYYRLHMSDLCGMLSALCCHHVIGPDVKKAW